MNNKLNCRLLCTLVLGFFVSLSAMAQEVTVKGHVKDASGEPIMLGTVQVKGTSTGTTTDMNGDFTLKTQLGATLVISYVGYVTQQVAAKSNVIVILQEDSKLLDESIVIGYATVKKSDATGSVTAIAPDDMSKGITTNATDMLMGKVAGVSVISSDGAPGGGASIRIRGGSSLNASNDPLIVIDGLAIDNNGVQGLTNMLSMVKPEDIETFTVLKDASATAIYGSRASNGVIIITTKKAKANTPTKVTYNGSVSLGFRGKTYDVMNGDEYRDYVTNTLGLSGSGLGTANTNWLDQVLQTAVSTDHQIGITGNAGQVPYRLSLGLTYKEGIIKTSSFNRFTAGLNLNPSLLNDHLKINFTSKYMLARNRYVDAGSIIGGAYNMDPTQPVTVDEGYEEFGGYWQSSTSATFNNPNWTQTSNTNTPSNPVAQLYNKNDKAVSTVLIGNIELDYKIHGFEDLHVHANLGGDYSEGRQRTIYSPYSYDNNYYGYDGVSQSYKYNLSGNIYLQYLHEWQETHNLDVMVGAEQQHFHRHTYSYGQGNDWYDSNGNLLEEATAYSPSLRSENTNTYRNSLVSYFGRLNYGLLDRYLLTATIRWDGSSRFASGNRWGVFPSVALAWKIKEESFLRDWNALDDLKLRLGWGITGQQSIGYDFYYVPSYTSSDQYAQYTLGNTNYYTSRPSMYNEDLKWEKTTTYNIGLDWSFLNGRIDGAIDWYYRKTTDLISSVSIASGLGFGNYQVRNIGSLRNTGLEVAVNAHPIVTKDFDWTVNYNFTWNDNEITKLTTASDYVETGDAVSYGLSNQVQVNAVGYAANSFYVYQQVYDDDGNPIEGVFVDRNGDGQITADDRYVYKNPTADVTMGLTNKFVWRNWDFSFSLRASLNNYLYYDFLSGRANTSSSGVYSNSAYNNVAVEAVKLGFTGATDYWCSDYFIRNASFLRCDQITLGYSFNRLFSTEKSSGIGGRVYVTVSNPFVITGYDGIDPERTHGSGVDGSVYPRPTTYMLGLSLNF